MGIILIQAIFRSGGLHLNPKPLKINQAHNPRDVTPGVTSSKTDLIALPTGSDKYVLYTQRHPKQGKDPHFALYALTDTLTSTSIEAMLDSEP